MNKQNKEWRADFDELVANCEQMYLSYNEYGGTVENLAKAEEEITTFIKNLLKEQLERVNKEVDEIYKEKYSHVTRDYNQTDQFRDDIRQKLDLIKGEI